MSRSNLLSAQLGIAGLCVTSFCISVFAQTSVVTQHNDNYRTGQNLNETILTPANVSSGAFGKVFSMPVDGLVVAQPLYVPNLNINGANHNVVFLATGQDTVYAYDADKPAAPLWQASMLSQSQHGATANAIPDPSSDSGCDDLPQYGITGTPVIDLASNTMYLVANSFEANYAIFRLHAIDLFTGAEKFGGPTTITASVPGTGTESSNSVVPFDPKWENQRAGLLLVNGSLYIAFGTHCDFAPSHGWLMAYDPKTLAQTSVFLTTPNGAGSGIWMGGSGLAADTLNGETRMFLATGNGDFNAAAPYATNVNNFGDDILRLNITNGLQVEDNFTVKDQAFRVANDLDIGSGGVLLLPDQPGPNPHLLVLTGKGEGVNELGEIYLVNRDNLGGYSATSNNIVQELDNQDTFLWGMPAYWNQNIYIWTAGDSLKQFSLTNGLLSPTPVATGLYTTITGLGSTPSISANGNNNGILWVVDSSITPEVLFAVDATNVATMLYSSASNPARDSAGPKVKYSLPTIANGKVYVASASQINVYGIAPQPGFSLSATASSVTVAAGSSASDTINILPVYGFSGRVVLSTSNLPAGLTASFVAGNGGTSAVATFAASAATVPGTYPVTVTGTSGTITSSIVINLQVQGVSGFTISAAPTALAIQQATSGISSSISVLGMNGFAGAVFLSASGLPGGVTASFSPASTLKSSTVTFTAAATAPPGSYAVTITGKAGSLTQTTVVNLTITYGLSKGSVQLVNKATASCMDVNGISTAVGAQIAQWYCWGGPNQLWNLTSTAGGRYEFVSINSGLALDISGSATTAGAVTIQNTYHAFASQQWAVNKTSDGYFNLVNGNSGQCLDGAESTLASGLSTQQQPCSNVVSQEWSLIPLSNNTPVNMAGSYNVNGIASSGSTIGKGGLDSGNYAFPSAVLGSSVNFYGFAFNFGPPDVPDAVSSATVALPAGQFNALYLLVTGVNGAQPNLSFKVNYSDGTSTIAQQSVNDWGSGTSLYPGELVALSSYRLGQSGKQSGTYNIFGFHMALDSTRSVVSVTLPNNRNVVTMAMTLAK